MAMGVWVNWPTGDVAGHELKFLLISSTEKALYWKLWVIEKFKKGQGNWEENGTTLQKMK